MKPTSALRGAPGAQGGVQAGSVCLTDKPSYDVRGESARPDEKLITRHALGSRSQRRKARRALLGWAPNWRGR
jgi:hypothetical protein